MVQVLPPLSPSPPKALRRERGCEGWGSAAMASTIETATFHTSTSAQLHRHLVLGNLPKPYRSQGTDSLGPNSPQKKLAARKHCPKPRSERDVPAHAGVESSEGRSMPATPRPLAGNRNLPGLRPATHSSLPHHPSIEDRAPPWRLQGARASYCFVPCMDALCTGTASTHSGAQKPSKASSAAHGARRQPPTRDQTDRPATRRAHACT
jgi:hypothetical protein